MEEHYGFKPDFLPTAPAQNCSCNLSLSSLSYPTGQNSNNCTIHYPPNSGNNIYPTLNNQTFPTFPTSSDFSRSSYSANHNNQAYQWVDSSSGYGTVPPSAVHGGMDADGHPIYVGRAHHEGDLIPAKVIPGKNAAYICHNGEEHAVDNYQILCKQNFEWVASHAGQLPPGAIPGGQTSDGEPLFIGRAYYEGSHTIGKIHPSHGVCYIPFGGKEIPCPQYETLVLRL